MKKLVTVLALTATVIASPAFARSHQHMRSSGTYTLDGKAVSHDPDPYVRLEELRDAESGSRDR
jgi:hypothetical protein